MSEQDSGSYPLCLNDHNSKSSDDHSGSLIVLTVESPVLLMFFLFFTPIIAVLTWTPNSMIQTPNILFTFEIVKIFKISLISA